MLRGRTIGRQPSRRTGLAAGTEWEVGGDPTANLSQLVWASWPVGGQSQVWPGLREWAQSPCSSKGPQPPGCGVGSPWPGRGSFFFCFSSFYNPIQAKSPFSVSPPFQPPEHSPSLLPRLPQVALAHPVLPVTSTTSLSASLLSAVFLVPAPCSVPTPSPPFSSLLCHPRSSPHVLSPLHCLPRCARFGRWQGSLLTLASLTLYPAHPPPPSQRPLQDGIRPGTPH